MRSSLSLLVSSQNDDGGWSWAGGTSSSNRYTSSRAVWALSLAKAAGYKVADDIFEKAIGYIQSQIATTAETDYDSKSVLLAAMASAGRGDFTLANRLYRNRPSLSTGRWFTWPWATMTTNSHSGTGCLNSWTALPCRSSMRAS